MQASLSSYLVHTIFNELSVVLGRAELISVMANDPESKESARAIKGAALNIRSLLHQLEQ